MTRFALAAAALLLAACGQLVEGRDYWVDQPNRAVLARSAQVAEAVCARRGADASPYRARNFSAGHASGPSSGCYDARDGVRVVAEDPAAPVAGIREHEDAHRGGWRHD